MNPVKLLLKVFAIGLLIVAFAGCSPKDDGSQSPDSQMTSPQNEEQVGPVGCCEEGMDSCSSPATKSECEASDGVFHKGKSCDLDSGKCGDGL